MATQRDGLDRTPGAVRVPVGLMHASAAEAMAMRVLPWAANAHAPSVRKLEFGADIEQ
jgi:hypothetical protein